MGNKLIFVKDLLNIDIIAQTQEDIFGILTKPLQDNGFVTKDYLMGVIEREKHFPTGLPTKPYGIALPHTSPKYVIESCISVGVVRTPVKFKVMGSDNNYVNVKVIFLLALNESQKQLYMLQSIMNMIRSKSLIEKIATQDENDVFEIINKNLI